MLSVLFYYFLTSLLIILSLIIINYRTRNVTQADWNKPKSPSELSGKHEISIMVACIFFLWPIVMIVALGLIIQTHFHKILPR